MPNTILYLHGLASSPESSKAKYLGALFRARGDTFLSPDLNHPSFTSITVTRILATIESELRKIPGDVTLIGSSMGGFSSATFISLAKPGSERVKKLVLLAPAFHFSKHKQITPEGRKAWEQAGFAPVWHSREKKEIPLAFNFLTDIEQYAPVPKVSLPTLVIHGRQDETIDYKHSEEFARRNAQVAKLHLLDTDHSMESSFEQMGKLVLDFA